MSASVYLQAGRAGNVQLAPCCANCPPRPVLVPNIRFCFIAGTIEKKDPASTLQWKLRSFAPEGGGRRIHSPAMRRYSLGVIPSDFLNKRMKVERLNMPTRSDISCTLLSVFRSSSFALSMRTLLM